MFKAALSFDIQLIFWVKNIPPLLYIILSFCFKFHTKTHFFCTRRIQVFFYDRLQPFPAKVLSTNPRFTNSIHATDNCSMKGWGKVFWFLSQIS
jgi:hypothetical protein